MRSERYLGAKSFSALYVNSSSLKIFFFQLAASETIVMFSGKQTTARKMADQLRTVLIKEHMGFTLTAYILRAQYEFLTL